MSISTFTLITKVETHFRIAFSQKMETMFLHLFCLAGQDTDIVRVMKSCIIAVKSRKEGTGQLRLAKGRH